MEVALAKVKRSGVEAIRGNLRYPFGIQVRVFCQAIRSMDHQEFRREVLAGDGRLGSPT